ncbi:MAG: Fe-S protein assembly co-chaperone HscB [Bryobacteraceae bacterium]|nr:Fe-S protein assembly co-chaperone HscB [Bryobacteraceae bacterium]
MNNHDYFGALGLDRRLSLDTADLQKRFYEQSRKLHPDRFVAKPQAEQDAALEASSVLNDAYRVLRDPVSRAEYLLKQEGFDIGEQRSKDVPPELLEEVFELNMALEELRHGDEDARGSLDQAHSRFAAMRDAIDGELQALFRAYDTVQDRAVLQQIRGALNRRRYIRNLVNEVEKELAPK